MELLQFYRQIEREINVHNSRRFNSLVNPLETVDIPIHNWYRFKEGYSPNLIREVIESADISGNIRLLDPFSGSGTSVLSSALDNEVNLDYGVGVEVNPFIHFMSSTKIRFNKLNLRKATKFLTYLEKINLNIISAPLDPPGLSTINRAYSADTLKQLLMLKFTIKEYFTSKSYEHDFFMLAYASILEEVGCMKKSGRALKIVRPIQDYDVKRIYLSKIKQMILDVMTNAQLTNNLDKIKIINQDVRKLNEKESKPFNLVVFSPPYLNHFDYTEVYKVELWMLDFVSKDEDFKALRHKTLRSHSSLKFTNTRYFENYNSPIIKQVMNHLEDLNRKEIFFKTIGGYIDDMYLTFSQLNTVTTLGATVVCIVANSLFGSVDNQNLTPVATDLLIAEVANDCGFDITEIKVARKLTRRGLAFPYGRESLIFMKKVKANTQVNEEVNNSTQISLKGIHA